MLITPVAILGFHSLDVPQVDLRERLKFTAVLMFDPSSDLSEIERATNAALMKKLGSEADKVRNGPNFFWPIADGDLKENPIYHGRRILKATSKFKPGCVDETPEMIEDPDEVFYSGCLVRAAISPYCWKYAGKSGVSFNLHHIQFMGDGERIGGQNRPEDVFGGGGRPVRYNDEPPF